ncbi:MAG TPA: type II secretion system F family protein [Acidimicrobiia bacterium]|nr:type II secretion system F family protein [Acidimicrobiia bacterium]
MNTAVVAGALFGLGLFGVAQGFRLRPVAARAGEPADGLSLAELGDRVGPLALRGAAVLRFDPARRRATDLAIVGRSAEQHAARSVLAAIWFGALAVLLGAVVGAGGVRVPAPWLAGGALAAGLSGPFVAIAVLKADAAERREDMLVDLGAFADLVVLLLAAGSGIEGALTTAADAGDDWTWKLLRDALRSARLTRRTPAEALTELGRTIDVVELEEFGAAVALASSSGVRLRESLAARSEALRARERARVEAQAASATERMTFPVVALAFGFLVVLGFPAVSRVLAGF